MKKVKWPNTAIQQSSKTERRVDLKPRESDSMDESTEQNKRRIFFAQRNPSNSPPKLNCFNSLFTEE